MDYDGINDAITRLNLKSTYDAEMLRDATRGWKEGRGPLDFAKDTPGKPVARSKTMPPQVPPRTYASRCANRKNATPGKNRRISAAPVRTSVFLLCPFPLSFRNSPTLCHSIDGSPPGSPVPRILQARTLEWVAISFCTKALFPKTQL